MELYRGNLFEFTRKALTLTSVICLLDQVHGPCAYYHCDFSYWLSYRESYLRTITMPLFLVRIINEIICQESFYLEIGTLIVLYRILLDPMPKMEELLAAACNSILETILRKEVRRILGWWSALSVGRPPPPQPAESPFAGPLSSRWGSCLLLVL